MQFPLVSRLTDALVAAGLPVQCVNANPNGTFSVILLAGSTPAQQTAANALVASYVDSPRVPSGIVSIYNQVQALTTVQQQKLMALAVAYLLQQNPNAAAALGINVVGDQPG
jgi:hypothetical protein